jgi:hypothetical protein
VEIKKKKIVLDLFNLPEKDGWQQSGVHIKING